MRITPQNDNEHERSNEVLGVVHGFGDLVVLINPAFEAGRYEVIDNFGCSNEAFSPHQPPVVLTVAAIDDDATLIWWPRAMQVLNHHDEKQKTTLGNYRNYRTHRLMSCPGTVNPEPEIECGVISCKKKHIPEPALSTSGAAQIGHCYGPAGLDAVRRPREAGCLNDTHLGTNPFIVAAADPEVIEGHNGLFAKSFLEFLADYFDNADRQISSASDSEKDTK